MNYMMLDELPNFSNLGLFIYKMKINVSVYEVIVWINENKR